jgi:hypothetical protein
VGAAAPLSEGVDLLAVASVPVLAEARLRDAAPVVGLVSVRAKLGK